MPTKTAIVLDFIGANLRHLLFHLTPMDTPGGQSCWKWHLRQLNHYAPMFDGQILIAVVSGPGMMPAEQVAPFLPPRAQLISLPNHPQLRESYTLPLLLARAYTVDPADTVFYAHSQGITWMGKKFEHTKRWWSLTMYRWLLSAQAMDLLKTHPIVGWLKYEGTVSHFPPHSKWHYAGVFCWFRAAEVYLRPWWAVTPATYGAEAYLSGLFPSQAAASLYRMTPEQYLAIEGDACPYRPEFWSQIGIPTGPDADSYEGSPV
jgi:hypothetical protein